MSIFSRVFRANQPPQSMDSGTAVEPEPGPVDPDQASVLGEAAINASGMFSEPTPVEQRMLRLFRLHINGEPRAVASLSKFSQGSVTTHRN